MPFRDVIGHRHLIRLLSRAVDDQSLPPSLILAGPRGVGKRLAAMSVAQALNCTTGSTADRSELPIDACGVCPSCTRIARGVHPDVLVVQPGENGSIKIDQVRDIIDRAAYRPFEGRRRVVIIDEADALVTAAQHALLKTLEEPPPSSVFMLVTSRPDVLLPTVLSRCPRLRFRPLDAAEVAEALVKQGRSEKEARAIAAAADGSIGHALEAAAGDLVEARDVAVRTLAGAAAASDARRKIELAKELLTNTGAGGAADRDQLAIYLRAMMSLLRDVMVVSIDRSAAVLANADLGAAIERLLAFRGDRGVHAFGATCEALDALERNAGVKSVADWLVLQL